ncbi:MAG: hypothetical protein ACO3AV_01510 [Ilumatobacteraceae bacterium]
MRKRIRLALLACFLGFGSGQSQEILAPPTPAAGQPGANQPQQNLDDLVRLFGDGWTLEVAGREVHHTPWAAAQPFTWVKLRRR